MFIPSLKLWNTSLFCLPLLSSFLRLVVTSRQSRFLCLGIDKMVLRIWTHSEAGRVSTRQSWPGHWRPAPIQRPPSTSDVNPEAHRRPSPIRRPPSTPDADPQGHHWRLEPIPAAIDTRHCCHSCRPQCCWLLTLSFSTEVQMLSPLDPGGRPLRTPRITSRSSQLCHRCCLQSTVLTGVSFEPFTIADWLSYFLHFYVKSILRPVLGHLLWDLSWVTCFETCLRSLALRPVLGRCFWDHLVDPSE